jgi:hypothetical protein
MSEFIANPGENPTKQDSELKAFDRLAQRLNARFPHLPICLTLDGMFACGRVFALCRKNAWRFVIVLKDGDIPTLDQEFLRHGAEIPPDTPGSPHPSSR